MFELLIDCDVKKGISITTITKMDKDRAVASGDVLVKIFTAIECTMDDIVEIIN
ncbi:MAG: XRE family transcriptional regulator [Butyrivibrio sp.]|nr:XRE family transcriptional regulator [Butyrivibrio sp.]